MSGKNISRYKILALLGRGGMGEVYLAEDTELGRKAALKFLPPQYISDPELKARFKREARAAASLNHPNIITIYDIGEHQNHAWMAMEFVDGESLRDLMARREPEIGDVLNLMMQACEGLGEAHRAGIIHRDVKPANILLDRRGRVKIADFGLARIEGATPLTRESLIMGTPAYMSPEQVRGKKLDARSDIFSLGIVLYELLTRLLPFKGDNELALFEAIKNQPPEPLARYNAGVSPGLQRIIDKALDKELETRYWSVEDLLVDLKREQRQLQEPAPPTATIAVPPVQKKKPFIPPPPAIKPRRSVPRPLLITAAALALVVLIYFTVKNRPSSPDESAAPVKKPAMSEPARPTPTDMVLVQAGTFKMGRENGDGDEKPVHEVYVEAFYMDVKEVTVEKFKRFIDATGYKTDLEKTNYNINWRYDAAGNIVGSDKMDLPVIYVSWNDATEYAKWLSRTTRAKYRLPTEAEWEYAAGGGHKAPYDSDKGNVHIGKYRYAGSDDLDEVGWYSENSNGKTHPVAAQKPNELGLYDMSGNVVEWCQDRYDSKYDNECKKKGTVKNPEGPEIGSHRVRRGGSWYGAALYCHSASRGDSDPANRSNSVGCRLVFVP